MRYKFYQYPRGANKGGILKTEICPTISTSSWENNCFLIEIYEDDEIQRQDDTSYNSFYWNTTQEFFRGELGGGIARCVKTDDSLATLVMKQTEDMTVQQVYADDGITRAVKAGGGSGNIPKVIEVGRVKEGKYKQRLEINENEMSNTITSVQKDSMVAEPMCSVHPNSHKFEFNLKTSIKPISPALRATDYKAPHCVYEPQVEQIGNIVDDTNIGFKNPQRGRIYSDEGLAPCLNCCGGGGLEPKIVQKFGDRGTDQYSVRDIAHTIPANPMSDRGQMLIEPSDNWQTVVGNKQLNPFRGSVDGTSPCITSACGMGGGMTPMLTDADLETTKQKEFIEQIRGHKEMEYRIRKLTPKECFRLMGVSEEDIDKIQAAGISNSQQYKMAGNSIVVDVLFHIFRMAFIENQKEKLTLF